jgi:hypothetical protein
MVVALVVVALVVLLMRLEPQDLLALAGRATPQTFPAGQQPQQQERLPVALVAALSIKLLLPALQLVVMEHVVKSAFGQLGDRHEKS